MSNENEQQNENQESSTKPDMGMEVGWNSGIVVVAFWDGDRRETYPMEPDTATTLSDHLRKAAKKARRPDAGG